MEESHDEFIERHLRDPEKPTTAAQELMDLIKIDLPRKFGPKEIKVWIVAKSQSLVDCRMNDGTEITFWVPHHGKWVDCLCVAEECDFDSINNKSMLRTFEEYLFVYARSQIALASRIYADKYSKENLLKVLVGCRDFASFLKKLQKK